jgi:hypothetical protein
MVGMLGTIYEYRNPNCKDAIEQADRIRRAREMERIDRAGASQNPLVIANTPGHPDRLSKLMVINMAERIRKEKEREFTRVGNLEAALQSASFSYRGLIRDDWVNENLDKLNGKLSDSEKKKRAATERKRESRKKMITQVKVISHKSEAIRKRDQRERKAAGIPKKLPMTGAARIKKLREKRASKAQEDKSCADTTDTSVTR